MTINSFDVFLPNLELMCCSRFGPNCCFLTCIQVSQEADKVVWYSHLFKNFLQFVVIHTVNGFSIVNETKVDVFLEFSCFFYDPRASQVALLVKNHLPIHELRGPGVKCTNGETGFG